MFSVGGANKRGAGTQGGAEDSGQDDRQAHVPTPAAAGTNGELPSTAALLVLVSVEGHVVGHITGRETDNRIYKRAAAGSGPSCTLSMGIKTWGSRG